MSRPAFRLRHGRRRGRGARELAGVTVATPHFGHLACHGGGLAWTRHAILRGRSLRASDPSREGVQGRGPPRPGLARQRRPAQRPAGRRTGPPPPRRGAQHPSGTDRWSGSDPPGRAAWACTCRTAPMPHQASQRAGSLPTTARRSGSAPAIRGPWHNPKPSSDLRNPRSAHLRGIPLHKHPDVEFTPLDRQRAPPNGAQIRTPEWRRERRAEWMSILADPCGPQVTRRRSGIRGNGLWAEHGRTPVAHNTRNALLTGPAPLSRTGWCLGSMAFDWSASPGRRRAAGSDPRSGGGSPGVRTRVGKRSAAARSRAGRFWSRADARISTETRRASGPRADSARPNRASGAARDRWRTRFPSSGRQPSPCGRLPDRDGPPRGDGGRRPRPRNPLERGASRVRRGGVPRQPQCITRGRLA